MDDSWSEMLFQLLRWNCMLCNLQENQGIMIVISTLHPTKRLHSNAFHQLWGHTLYICIRYIHKWQMHWYDKVTYLHIKNVPDFALYFTKSLFSKPSHFIHILKHVQHLTSAVQKNEARRTTCKLEQSYDSWRVGIYNCLSCCTRKRKCQNSPKLGDIYCNSARSTSTENLFILVKCTLILLHYNSVISRKNGQTETLQN